MRIHSSFKCLGDYRRCGNFCVKCTSPFNFSRCFIFVARAHRRKLNHAKILYMYTCTFLIPGPDTMSHHWREAGASDQRERGNAADTHAVSLVERELPSATYLKTFHPSVSVRGSNCLQKFAFAIARLGWYRRAQLSSRIRNTIDRFLVVQQNHAYTSIHARKLTR